MIELVLEALLWVGWWFPVWFGSGIVRVVSLGYARVDDETLAGCIGIAAVLGLAVLAFVLLR